MIESINRRFQYALVTVVVGAIYFGFGAAAFILNGMDRLHNRHPYRGVHV